MFRILIFVGLILLVSCTENTSKVVENRNAGEALGTSYSIIYQADQKFDYQKEIDSVFETINHSLSTYLPDSDISRINNGDTTVVVDHMFEEVFNLSKEVYDRTNGYFDPTVGVLVNAWGFGPGKQIQLDSAKVDSLMNYVGFDKVRLTAKNKIEKSSSFIRFDFNAIAKGYAIDRLAEMMDARNIQNYLLEVGGEIVAKGENQIKQKPWGVGIDDPQNKEGRSLKKLIRLKNKAMASSGNYRKFRIDAATGQKYVHTVNPKTGFTKNGKTLAANVLASTCAEADAYATAFMAMELDKAIEIINANKELEGYIIYLDEKGETQEFMTEGFEILALK